MSKKTKQVKLALNKKTISNLNNDELKSARGGSVTVSDTCGTCHTTCLTPQVTLITNEIRTCNC